MRIAAAPRRPISLEIPVQPDPIEETAMARIAPLSRQVLAELEDALQSSEARMRFLPNSQRFVAHQPELLRGFVRLAAAIDGPGSAISPELSNRVSQGAAGAAGYGFCTAHTAQGRARRPAARQGVGAVVRRNEPVFAGRARRKGFSPRHARLPRCGRNGAARLIDDAVFRAAMGLRDRTGFEQ